VRPLPALRKPPALLGEFLIGFVDGIHASHQRFSDGGLVGDVGEPLGLARLAERVDVHAGRLAEVLDGLVVGLEGRVVVAHVCVGCAVGQVYITTVPVYAMG